MTLSKATATKLDELAARYPTRMALTLPGLYLVQDEAGWISPQAMIDLAEHLDLSPAYVRGVATFYTMFRKDQVGRYLIQVCTNLSCQLMGSDTVLACLERKLGVKPGETTADGKFTVVEVECLASCGTAPMMQINDTYYEDLTEAKVEQILASLG